MFNLPNFAEATPANHVLEVEVLLGHSYKIFESAHKSGKANCSGLKLLDRTTKVLEDRISYF